MEWYQIILIVIMFLLLFVMFFNPKIRLFNLIKQQMKVFIKYNPKVSVQKISLHDMFTFILSPIFISLIIVLGFNFTFSEEVANLLVTVFSIIFTVLFGFISVLVGKANSSNKLEKQLVSETFTSIVSAMLLAILSAVLLIIYISMPEKTLYIKLISNIVIWFSLESLLLLLMITKRSYVIFSNAK
ncbi:MAG: hypothetical protein AB7V00_00635 [Bacilli bacterium]